MEASAQASSVQAEASLAPAEASLAQVKASLAQVEASLAQMEALAQVEASLAQVEESFAQAEASLAQAAGGIIGTGGGIVGTGGVIGSSQCGLQIVDLDQEAEFIDAVQDHAIHCKHKLVAAQEQKKTRIRSGSMLELPILQDHNRATCWSDCAKTDHTYGPDTSELNLLLAGAAYVSGILNEKLQEFSAEAGLGCSTHRSLKRLREKVQDATEVVSNQLMSVI